MTWKQEIPISEYVAARPGIEPPNGMVGLLVVLRIYVTLAVFQPYRDLESGD